MHQYYYYYNYYYRRKQSEEARVTLKSLVGKVVKKPIAKVADDKDNNKTLNGSYIDPMLSQLKDTDVSSLCVSLLYSYYVCYYYM